MIRCCCRSLQKTVEGALAVGQQDADVELAEEVAC